MSLARVWRRQLLGASTAALIVPSAMLAALVALALGGAFRGVGVLGQLFAGPSLALGGPTAGAHPGSGGSGSERPRVGDVAAGDSGGWRPRRRSDVRVVGGRRPGRTLLTASRGPSGAGGAIGGGGAVHPVTLGRVGRYRWIRWRPARTGRRRVRRVFGVRAGVRLWVTGA